MKKLKNLIARTILSKNWWTKNEYKNAVSMFFLILVMVCYVPVFCITYIPAPTAEDYEPLYDKLQIIQEDIDSFWYLEDVTVTSISDEEKHIILDAENCNLVLTVHNKEIQKIEENSKGNLTIALIGSIFGSFFIVSALLIALAIFFAIVDSIIEKFNKKKNSKL